MIVDNYTIDNGLSSIQEADEFHLCSQEPTTFAEVSTYTLGVKASPVINVPEDNAGNGRKVTIGSIVDGSATATGTGTHWVLIDTVNSRLRVVGALTSNLSLTLGDTFTVTSSSIVTSNLAVPV